MSTPQRCLAQAQEAERPAAVVPYGRDRERLIGEAAEWRARASELEAAQASPERDAASPERGGAASGAAPRSWLRRCSEALFGPRPPRGG